MSKIEELFENNGDEYNEGFNAGISYIHEILKSVSFNEKIDKVFEHTKYVNGHHVSKLLREDFHA